MHNTKPEATKLNTPTSSRFPAIAILASALVVTGIAAYAFLVSEIFILQVIAAYFLFSLFSLYLVIGAAWLTRRVWTTYASKKDTSTVVTPEKKFGNAEFTTPAPKAMDLDTRNIPDLAVSNDFSATTSTKITPNALSQLSIFSENTTEENPPVQAFDITEHRGVITSKTTVLIQPENPSLDGQIHATDNSRNLNPSSSKRLTRQTSATTEMKVQESESAENMTSEQSQNVGRRRTKRK